MKKINQVNDLSSKTLEVVHKLVPQEGFTVFTSDGFSMPANYCSPEQLKDFQSRWYRHRFWIKFLDVFGQVLKFSFWLGVLLILNSMREEVIRLVAPYLFK